jgi:predicted nicotinamide N-methyase
MDSTVPDDPDEACSTQFFENFAFKDSEFKIKQDTFVGHNAVIWDAARVLAKYFEFSSADWKGKKVLKTTTITREHSYTLPLVCIQVLDLGSGCGLVGICLASLDALVRGGIFMFNSYGIYSD